MQRTRASIARKSSGSTAVSFYRASRASHEDFARYSLARSWA